MGALVVYFPRPSEISVCQTVISLSEQQNLNSCELLSSDSLSIAPLFQGWLLLLHLQSFSFPVSCRNILSKVIFLGTVIIKRSLQKRPCSMSTGAAAWLYNLKQLLFLFIPGKQQSNFQGLLEIITIITRKHICPAEGLISAQIDSWACSLHIFRGKLHISSMSQFSKKSG